MSYLAFHAVFNLPLLVVCALLAAPGWSASDSAVTAGVVALVVAFTSPWDNWAVARGLWDFPADRIIGRLGWCPWEEYAFFVIQTVQGCLLADACLERGWTALSKSDPSWVGAAGVSVLWLGLASAWWLSGRARSAAPYPGGRAATYLVHLLFWTVPVVLLHWTLGGWWAGSAGASLLVTVALGTTLSLADLVAIRRGIWHFDRSQTLGLTIASMPLEEILFFYITSLLVAQSFILLRAG